MPVNSANQGIPEQQGADPANLPSAQVSWDGVMENRLVQRYASIADRTARRPAPNENELSTLVDVDRVEVYDSANWISGFSRDLYANIRRNADGTAVNNSIAPVSDAVFVVALPTAGIFQWEHLIFYDSATAAGIRFDYTSPAGSSGLYGSAGGLTHVAAGTSGPAQFAVGLLSGAQISYGGAGVGTIISLVMNGEITMGGTAGNLQFQMAQATANVSNTTVKARSRLRMWRVS